MFRFQLITRLTVLVLGTTLGLLIPVAADARVSPANTADADGTASAAGARAGAGDRDAWSYLMPGHEARWNPCTRIGYRLNLRHSPQGTVAQVEAALQRVSAESGLRFVYRGTTGVLPGGKARSYPADTDIVMAWSRPERTEYLVDGIAGYAGASAYHAVAPDGAAWALTNGFAVFDQAIYKQLAAGFGLGHKTGYQGTRGQILMHELGHVVGLGHTPRDTRQSMFPSMSRKYAVWGAGDLTGLTKVGATQGCLTAAPQASAPAPTMIAALR